MGFCNGSMSCLRRLFYGDYNGKYYYLFFDKKSIKYFDIGISSAMLSNFGFAASFFC